MEDNFSDYYADLCSVKAGSLLEELDEDSTRAWFKNLLESSVAFMLLTRCGIDAGEHFAKADFAHVFEFNTPETLSILGTATSDISEMALREIATTVLSLYREEQKQNRTFADRPDTRYNDGRIKTERNSEHGTDLQDRGRLPSAQPGRAGGTEGRKIWDAAAQLPSQKQERDLHRDDVVRQAGQPSGGDRPAGHRDGGEPDGADSGGAGREREPESVRSDDVGGPDEQHPGVGGGSGADGAGVRLSDPLPSEEEQRQAIKEAEDEKSPAFSISQEDIDAVLLHGSGVADGKFRIYERFETVWNSGENAPFLKEEYKSTTYFSVTTDKELNAWCDPSGLKISIENQPEPKAEVKLTWKKMAKRISQLVEVERYLSPAEQEQYPEYQRQHDTRAARRNVSEEFWSIINDYNDYWTQLGQKDKYLEGYPLALCRSAFASGQKKMYQTREGKYILPLMREAMQAIIEENTHLTERCEAILAELSGPLATPLEPTDEELNPPPKDYHLSLGATVYLGAQEYELLAFDEQTVRLFDPSFPLINKELPRAEFDRLLAENPQNDHLAEDVPPADGPQAVGRIDYLNKDGTARESIEYTDAEHLIAKTKEESGAAAPMRIVVYRDTEGQTIPLDFIKDLHPLRQKFRVVDYEDQYWKETPGYDLGYGHLGNGLTVWNSLEEEHGDYKTIAHISPDRTVKFYVDDLPEDARAQIEHIAATSDATISATQNAPVFSTPPLGREPGGVGFWNDYNSIKEHDPDSLLLYQVGDFFELYGGHDGEDANMAASVLNLTLTTRTIPDIGRVSMCGFPVHKLDDCMERLTSAGLDVNVAKLKKDRHEVSRIPAPDLEKAKRIINEFCMDEYDTEADFSDLRNIALAHSATGDVKHSIDISTDLVGCCLFYQVDGEVVASLQCRDLDDLSSYLANLDFDEMIAFAEEQHHKAYEQDSQPQQETEVTEPQYEIRDTPYIFCEWSESIAFQDKTVYSISEFDRLMKQADDEYTAGSAAAMKKYGTWQKWYDAKDPEYKAFLSYEKVKFTIVMPDGRTFTERQDVVDGDGGVLDYLSKFDAYREIVPILREAARQEAEASQAAPETQPETDDFSDIDPAAVRAALAEHGIVDGHVVDEDKLNANPFVQQVMADVERIAAEAPLPDERFSIIETEKGYAVWDDVRDEIYADSDGIQEEFTSEWQAEDYLKQVKKAVADKEAAEWLAVERAKQGQEPPPSVSQRRGEGKAAEYLFDQERIVIFQYPNSKFYNHYGYDEQRDFSHATAGGFDTLEEAEKMLLAHRPKAEKVLEPAEKETTTEKGTESSADGHDHTDKTPPLPPPAPQRRAKVSPFVLHPEIPAADRHEYQITNDAIGVGTPGERFKNNVRAIRLLKKLEAEDRFATPEEQNVLAQYVGWGGLSDCFDEKHSKYAELKALLTEDEYEAAAASTLTAFYTPPVVIRSIYQALANMGFKTGNLLDTKTLYMIQSRRTITGKML